MDEITPAQPSEGATFLRLADVPDDWEVAGYSRTGETEWYPRGRYRAVMVTPRAHVVEARPPRPRMVTIELTEEDARRYMSNTVDSAWNDMVRRPLAAALAELDAEQ